MPAVVKPVVVPGLLHVSVVKVGVPDDPPVLIAILEEQLLAGLEVFCKIALADSAKTPAAVIATPSDALV